LPLLLDTHAFLWWLDGDPNLTARAKRAISADPTKVHVSGASAWEISTKARIGKLPDALESPQTWPAASPARASSPWQ